MHPSGVYRKLISANALNVNVTRFTDARVNGGSNYDSLKVAKCLVFQLETRMNGLMRFPLSQLLSSETTVKGTDLKG